MTSIIFTAEYAEIPFARHEAAVEINKLANHLKAGKDLDVEFPAEKTPKTVITIRSTCFTTGTAKKIALNCLQLCTSAGSIMNFSKKEKKISIQFQKNWVMKALMSGIREFYSINDPGGQYYLSPGNETFTLCKVTQSFNYCQELTGPQYSRLTKCYEKRDEDIFVPVNPRHQELLRLIAPTRDVDKDTSFMSQVAPLSGLIDANEGEEGGQTELITARDELIARGWIYKLEGNYEVTESFRKVTIYSVADLL
jgi:hypothetical protein